MQTDKNGEKITLMYSSSVLPKGNGALLAISVNLISSVSSP
jgi:hypothetical protein